MSRLKCCWIVSAVSVLTLPTTVFAQTDTGREADKVKPATAEVDNQAPAVARPDVAAFQPVPTPPAPLPREEPPSAPKQSVGLSPLETGPTAMKGKWNPVFYGFLSFDMVRDSTQSFSGGSPGYVAIARPGTYAAAHGRTVFDPRGSRFGFKLAAPEMDGMKATAVIEADFLGNQLPMNYGVNPTGISENSTYGNGLLRLRHAAIKIESRYVDILAGQYWQLFGWMPMYLPVTLQVPGYPGVSFGRNAQFRVSHTFKTAPINVELAVAAVRPAQRNGEYPDTQGGARLMVNGLRGVSAVGATGGAFFEMPAGLAVSGIYRHINLPEFAAVPTKQNAANAGGVSVDLFLPVIPSNMANKGNALNLTGNFTYGRGIGDLYAPGTIGGAGFPNLPNPNGVWAYGYIGYAWGTTFHPFNNHANTATVYGAFRSEHTGGANFVLADGSVRFVRDTITPETYSAYGSRAGGETANLD